MALAGRPGRDEIEDPVRQRRFLRRRRAMTPATTSRTQRTVPTSASHSWGCLVRSTTTDWRRELRPPLHSSRHLCRVRHAPRREPRRERRRCRRKFGGHRAERTCELRRDAGCGCTWRGLRDRNMVEELGDRQHADESECDKHNVHACGPVEKDGHEHGGRKCGSPKQPDMCVDPTSRTSQHLQRTHQRWGRPRAA